METNEPKPGFMLTGILLALAVLVTLVAGAAIGLMAADSEEMGVVATYVAALPLGAAWGAAIASLVVYFVVPRPSLARWLAPLGCAVLGGIGLLGLLAAFFLLIFPAL